MSAGRDGAINQDCRGMKIGGWGFGIGWRIVEYTIKYFHRYRSLTPMKAYIAFFKTPNDLRTFADLQITKMSWKQIAVF